MLEFDTFWSPLVQQETSLNSRLRTCQKPPQLDQKFVGLCRYAAHLCKFVALRRTKAFTWAMEERAGVMAGQFSTLAFLPLFEGSKVMFFPALMSSNLLKSQCFFQVSGYLKEAEKLSIWNLRNRAF